MCTAYETLYVDCGCTELMIDDCDKAQAGNHCEERENIEKAKEPAKTKTVNAKCPKHQ
jgi:hypothetical protein